MSDQRPGDGAGLTDNEIAAIRRVHFGVPDLEDDGTENGERTCQIDAEPFPCPVIRILDAYTTLTAERDAALAQLAEADALAVLRQQILADRDEEIMALRAQLAALEFDRDGWEASAIAAIASHVLILTKDPNGECGAEAREAIRVTDEIRQERLKAAPAGREVSGD